jgi:xanthine dehydrogenase iron-sulfur cluster and FAD-binding subunit A
MFRRAHSPTVMRQTKATLLDHLTHAARKSGHDSRCAGGDYLGPTVLVNRPTRISRKRCCASAHRHSLDLVDEACV